MNSRRSIFILFVLTLFASCNTEPVESFSSDISFIRPGDVVVTSYSSDSALLLDENGNFKSVLYNVQNNIEQVVGVNWDATRNEVVLSINGAPDRLMAISAYDGSIREAVVNNQLNGNTFGVATDSDGNYYATESNNIEKFTKTGSRITDSTFPILNIQTTPSQLNPRSIGGFVLCSTGTDAVRTYNAAFTQLATRSSGIGGTTNAYGCAELADGNIAVSWDGTTDSVQILNSTLTTVLYTFDDPSYLSGPRGIGAKANGNFLVADATFDWIIELNSSGEFERVFSSAFLNDPWQIIEIPSF